MKHLRIVALLLALVFAATCFAACGGTPGSGTETRAGTEAKTETQPETEADPWASIDFGGETLRISVNALADEEQTFPAADIYSRGPDTLDDAKDTVEKMVFDRNRNLESRLGLQVEWMETNLSVGTSQVVLENYVLGDMEHSPDIFINDNRDVIGASFSGVLWNVLDPTDGDGQPVRSYFDFSSPCWYMDYMKGTTLRHDKIYALSGDYFTDMLRFAYTLFLNTGLYDDTFADTAFADYRQLYLDILDGYWDYERLAVLIETGYRDGGNEGVTDRDDLVIGLTVGNDHLARVSIWTCGLSIVGWEGEPGESTPYIIEDNQPLFEFCERFSALYNTEGVLYTSVVLEGTTLFFNGNVLFALSMLGELGSEQLRATDITKGVVPFPKYDEEIQPDYKTHVHNQAEIGCILSNTKHFTEASAYLQLANEWSTPILAEYYEKSLKLRYTDDKDTRAMIDLIHDHMGSAFNMTIGTPLTLGRYPNAHYSGQDTYQITLAVAKERKSTFVSDYTSNVEGWKDNLSQLMEIFDALP